MNMLVAYLLAGCATALVAFWTLLYMRYNSRFDAILASIDSNQFLMPELFFIGFGFMDMFHVNLKSERGRKKQKRIAELHGEKYAEYYHYCITGGQYTYGLTLLPLGLLIGAATNDIMFALLTIAVAVVLIVYLDLDVENAVEKRRGEILADYPEVLSKLTLLVNAGLVVRDAWAKVADTSDHPLYREMKISCDEMQNGVAEADAYFNFAQRCGVKEIRKFASVLTQNLQKGGSELTTSLRFMNEEAWEEKKHRAKRAGEAAGDKLMAPLMVMFAGILLMIIVPVFGNMF